MSNLVDSPAVERNPQREQLPVMRRAGITLLGSAIGGALVIFNEFLAAHYLKVQSYGLYASGLTVARIGEAVAVYGLPVAIFHYIPPYLQKSQHALVVGIVYAAALLPLLIGSTFAIVLWFLAPWLANHMFHSIAAVPFIRMLVLAVPFMASSEVLCALTRGYGHAKYYVMVRNLCAPLLFLLLFLAIAKFAAPPLWITGVVLLSNILTFVAAIFCVVRVAGDHLWRVRPTFAFSALYRYASGIMMNTFLYMVFAVTGIVSVAQFLGSDAVGIYRVCLQVVVPFEMVILAFHAAMGTVYPVLERENRRAELADAYASAVRWMSIMLLPIGVVLAWNRVELLALFGSRFTAGASALLILAAGYSVCTCYGTGAYLLMLSGRKSIETINAAIATVMNIALCVLLVPRIGLAGAATATATSFFVLNVLRVVEVRHLAGIRTFQPYFLRVVVVSIGGSLVSFAVLQLLGIAQSGRAAVVVARILLMVVAHSLFMWTLGLDRRDKETVKSLLSAILWRWVGARA